MFYQQLEQAIYWFSDLISVSPLHVFPLLAILLVCLICGGVGSLVVGNRMAFFSDALAHCAFAGVALGILLALIFGRPLHEIRGDRFLLIGSMVGFGIVVGVLIALVREKTSLSNDTVIGVFFAGAMGLGAMLMTAVTQRGYFNLEAFLFGGAATAEALDLEILIWVVVFTGIFLSVGYNGMVFTSFSTSLARSRGVQTRLFHYLFIVLLGIIVNLAINIVGVLLINAMLIVPAATAANWSRNMRQFFLRTVVLAVLSGAIGVWLSHAIRIPDPSRPNDPLKFGVSGTIIVTSVLFFILSMLTFPRFRRGRRPPGPPESLHYSVNGPRMVASAEPEQAPPA